MTERQFIEWMSQERDIDLAYRDTFSTHQGQRVLVHLLGELGAFRLDAMNEKETALAQFGRQIMHRVGFRLHNMPELLENAMRLPLLTKEMEKALKENDDG